MKDALAERLLAQVMGWTHENVANECPLLQAMAALKYDEYQQFAPGIRFVESLALWLHQFSTPEERQTAYDFVKSRLVFFSAAEIAHLVTITYPDHIRPLLIRQAAEYLKLPERCIARIAASEEYRALRRQCLFLGLSDGAHIDTFRRSTTELSNEQIWLSYDVSKQKNKDMLDRLRADLAAAPGGDARADKSVFRMVFLLDDFSGSGITYLRREDNETGFGGKLLEFKRRLENVQELVSLDDLYVGVVLYIATQRAVDHIQPLLKELFDDRPGIRTDIRVVHLLDDDVTLNAEHDEAFLKVAQKYYDPSAENEHTRKGGTRDVRLGFAGCSLPVVLCHNTPNDSVFLLWADRDQLEIRGLFPRVNRHRSEP